ncbi:SulP family inorganic anion transporter [Nannocystis pusilla]|uniref:STAS domain-containing protein n=1 Tax=Nannocystis pusilla TaxID=889268 RepID=A0ABS7TKS1_9BACT|nr:SulP family inorganic anion transporter [Nannocystis pusilla]MBZ5708820.1 STAS domain-containing protein [Nannocystis pusilla]
MHPRLPMRAWNKAEGLSGVEYWRESVALTASSLRSALTTRVGPNIAAGVTVALVALPLNMALAIACGLPASVGLVTGAAAGVIGAVFGGSSLQITGPEVALAPITFEIISRHGFDGLLVVTILAGLMQIALGALRVGRLVHAIPVPVVGGFLAAVGLMVFDSQLPVLLGLSEEARLVSEMTPAQLAGLSWPSVLLGLLVVGMMIGLPRLNRRLPAPLLALAVAMLLVSVCAMPVVTIDHFDGGWPAFGLPAFDDSRLGEYLAEAVALALLASMDSLLCMVSIDARTGGRSRTDQDLVAQGLANIGSACFGGMPVAAAVVRSAAAVEAGATSRLAPTVQSFVLALVVVAFARFVGHVPLVALASILLVVGWRLFDWDGLRHMWGTARFEVGIFVGTAAGILLTDFVIGVLIGVLLALVFFAHRQRELVRMRRRNLEPDQHALYENLDGVRVIHLEGPLFFASQAKIDSLFDDLDGGRPVVVDLAEVPTLDTSGARALVRAAERLAGSGTDVWLSSLSGEASTMLAPIIAESKARLQVSDTLDDALRRVAARMARPSRGAPGRAGGPEASTTASS